MIVKTALETGRIKKKQGDGTTPQTDYSVEILNDGHLDQIMGLQATIIQNLSHPGLMAPIDFEFMKAHIDRQGFILGVLADGQLIAYRIVYFPHRQDKVFNMGIDIGLAEDQLSKVANLQMVCVDPAFRGNALASKLNRLAIGLLKANFDCEHLFATVSPDNIWNVRILLNCGFCLTRLKLKYGGKLRYIAYQKLDGPITFENIGVVYTDFDDLDAQDEIFNSGFYGVALAQKQPLENGSHKKNNTHNYILFKKPSRQFLVHTIKTRPSVAKNTTEVAVHFRSTEMLPASRWNIAGDPSVVPGSIYPTDRLNQKGVPE